MTDFGISHQRWYDVFLCQLGVEDGGRREHLYLTLVEGKGGLRYRRTAALT